MRKKVGENYHRNKLKYISKIESEIQNHLMTVIIIYKLEIENYLLY